MTKLKIPAKTMKKLFAVDKAEWRQELADHKEYFKQFGSKMPKELLDVNAMIEKRIG
jgi:phosphoenolpyruvate carboxykinase (GTP)